MDNSNYLEATAQLAGVFVGFANLANAIYRPNIRAKDYQLNRIRIITTTELGLLTVLYCIIPLIFQSKDIPVITGTKYLSLLMCFIGLVYTSLAARRNKKLMGTTFPMPYISKLYVYGGFGLAFLNGANGFGLFGEDNVVFVFDLVILIFFVGQALLFIRLINWILSNQDLDQSPIN